MWRACLASWPEIRATRDTGGARSQAARIRGVSVMYSSGSCSSGFLRPYLQFSSQEPMYTDIHCNLTHCLITVSRLTYCSTLCSSQSQAQSHPRSNQRQITILTDYSWCGKLYQGRTGCCQRGLQEAPSRHSNEGIQKGVPRTVMNTR